MPVSRCSARIQAGKSPNDTPPQAVCQAKTLSFCDGTSGFQIADHGDDVCVVGVEFCFCEVDCHGFSPFCVMSFV